MSKLEAWYRQTLQCTPLFNNAYMVAISKTLSKNSHDWKRKLIDRVPPLLMCMWIASDMFLLPPRVLQFYFPQSRLECLWGCTCKHLKMSLSSLESGRNRLPYEKEYFLRMLNDIESHVHRGPPPAELNNWKPDPTLEVDKVMIKASTKDVDKLLVNTYPNSAAAALKNKHSSSASSTSSSSTNLSSTRQTSK